MDEKIPITILLTKKQVDKLKEESNRTGNSQNSIVRTALTGYWREKNV